MTACEWNTKKACEEPAAMEARLPWHGRTFAVCTTHGDALRRDLREDGQPDEVVDEWVREVGE